MIYDLFISVLKMSAIASITSVVIMPAKYILKKSGCRTAVVMLLWLVIAFRFLSPYAPESELSLFNLIQKENTVDVYSDEILLADPSFQSNRENSVELKNNYSSEYYEIIYSRTKLNNVLGIFAAHIWFGGVLFSVILSVLSYLKLKHNLRFAVKSSGNIYVADNISTSFVFGVFKPKIYIPQNISAEDRENIIIHELIHIRRLDHIFKIFAWTVVLIHWFNPLVWILFKLFSNDMEFACDEAVIKKIGNKNKKSYLNSLLSSAMSSPGINLPYNLCSFSSQTKARVKNIIKTKRYSSTVNILAIAFCLAITFFAGTNNVSSKDLPKSQDIAYEKSDRKFTSSAENTNDLATERENNTISTHNKKTSQSPAAPSEPYKPSIPEENEPIIDSILSDAVPQQFAEEPPNIESPNPTQPIYTPIHNPLPDNVPADDPEPTKNASGLAPQNDKHLKFTEKADELYVGYAHLELEEMSIEKMESELSQTGAVPADSNADLSQNYVMGSYSSDNSSDMKLSGIKCDNNGNISLYIDMNTETHFSVNIYDSETKESVGGYGILADGKNAYSFLGFDKNKAYDISINESTQGEWKVEGNYIIY